MDKQQALYSFFAGFGVPAFDENTVPDVDDFEEMGLKPFPRITYQVITDNLGSQNIISASIWDRNPSWDRVDAILGQIEDELGYGGTTVRYNNGLLWLTRGMPFAQRMGDEDDSIRRIVLSIQTEYMSEV